MTEARARDALPARLTGDPATISGPFVLCAVHEGGTPLSEGLGFAFEIDTKVDPSARVVQARLTGWHADFPGGERPLRSVKVGLGTRIHDPSTGAVRLTPFVEVQGADGKVDARVQVFFSLLALG